MKFKWKSILAVLPVIAVILLAFSGNIMSLVKEPSYTLISAQDKIQIREYSPIIVAQVSVSGERKEAISAGFEILADYIFGNNKSSKKLSIAKPSVQEDGEKIAMTAPVMQQVLAKDKNWTVKFVMPVNYTLENLPKPNNNQVKIIKVPAKKYAVISFSGLATDTSLQKNTDVLNIYLSSHNIDTVGSPIFAFYNPPWTIPFLRRNEIMLELKDY